MADFVAPDYVPSDVLEHPVTEIPDIPGWKKAAAGKVREIFIPEDAAGISTADRLMLVATDRISAYDFILDTPIPGKGAVLTQLSRWWFNQLNGLVDTHYLDVDVPAEVAGRAMITRRLEMYPVECVARGYLTGSGLAEYQQSGAVCGIALPPGLREASKLSEPIFTPAIKAELGEHDENVSAGRIAQLHGRAVAKSLTDLTLLIYRKAAEIAAERGIILADTKFEFGALPGHYVHGDTLNDAAASCVLGDEVIFPLLARRCLGGRPGHPQFRQAVCAGLADGSSVRVGPSRRCQASGSAARGGPAHQRTLLGGLPDSDRRAPHLKL